MYAYLPAEGTEHLPAARARHRRGQVKLSIALSLYIYIYTCVDAHNMCI